MAQVLGMKSGRACGLLAIASVVVLTGCQSGGYDAPPPPPRERVIDDPAIDAVTLLEFSDQVGESIVNQISSIEEIANAPGKVKLILGRIENKTYGTTVDDFQIAQRRLRSKLVNSDVVRRKCDLIERPEVMAGDFEALAPKGSTQTGPAKYDPEITYILTGYFGEIARGGPTYSGGATRSTYYSEFSLTHLASSRTVFTDTKDTSQGRR